ncbi:hypothetical protein TPAR_02779, partial [Tolypocladium paradoxum]
MSTRTRPMATLPEAHPALQARRVEDVPARRHHVQAPREDARHAAAVIVAGFDDGNLEHLPADGAVDYAGTCSSPSAADAATLLGGAAGAAAAGGSGGGGGGLVGAEPDGQAAGLDVVLAEHGVVVPRLGGPGPGHAEPRPDDLLRGEDDDLQPDPGAEQGKGAAVGLRVEEVVLLDPEVGDGEEAQDGLADDEVPAEGAAAVAQRVAADLGQPEGEVGGGAEVEEEGAGAGVPRRRGDGEEGDAEAEEDEAADDGLEGLRLRLARRGGGRRRPGHGGCGGRDLGVDVLRAARRHRPGQDGSRRVGSQGRRRRRAGCSAGIAARALALLAPATTLRRLDLVDLGQEAPADGHGQEGRKHERQRGQKRRRRRRDPGRRGGEGHAVDDDHGAYGPEADAAHGRRRKRLLHLVLEEAHLGEDDECVDEHPRLDLVGVHLRLHADEVVRLAGREVGGSLGLEEKGTVGRVYHRRHLESRDGGDGRALWVLQLRLYRVDDVLHAIRLEVQQTLARPLPDRRVDLPVHDELAVRRRVCRVQRVVDVRVPRHVLVNVDVLLLLGHDAVQRLVEQPLAGLEEVGAGRE